MRAREGVLASSLFGEQLDLLYPIIESGGSDSAAFDNVLELLVVNGVLTLPEAVMMLIPEAWQGNDNMDPEKKAFYKWAARVLELIRFTELLIEMGLRRKVSQRNRWRGIVILEVIK